MKKLVLLYCIALFGFASKGQNACDSLPRIEQADMTVCAGNPISLNVKNYYLDSVLASFNYIGSFGGSRYFASTVPQLWWNAQAICLAAGGHLVTMGSAAENTFVGSYNPGTFYWIGFYQNLSSGSYAEPAGGWEWITGEPVIFTGWAGGEPNQNNGEPEDFVYTNFSSMGQWNDAPSVSPGFAVALQYVLEIEDDFTILWSTGDTTDTISVNPLATTTYYVTTSDSVKSCYDSITITVNNPDPNLPDTVTTCMDSVELAATVGLTSYLWNTLQTDSAIWATTTGNYTVSVLDQYGCTDTDTVVVSVLNANINQVDTAFCGGGSIVLTADSVMGNSFLWSTAELSASISVTPMASVVYTVDVSDGIGTCSDSVVMVVSNMQSLITSQDISCAGSSDGLTTVSVSGGVGGYTYLWSSADTVPSLSGLAVATYNVTTTDSLGCTVIDSVAISQPNLLFLSTVIGDVLCFGDSNGSIDLTASGGTIPYQYSWSTGDTIEDLVNLASGSYGVFVSDTLGCQDSLTILVGEPALLALGASLTHLSCNGDSSGAIDIAVLGGTMPYNYLWTSSDTSEDRVGLDAGTYTVLVTDSNGCQDSLSATITEPAILALSATLTDNLCAAGMSGAIDLVVAGGTVPYMYSWLSGDSTEDISGIASGSYFVLVTDTNGCKDSLSATITEPTALMLVATTTDALCGGALGNTGAVDLTVAGGVTPYVFSWQNGPTTEDLSMLAGGFYTVMVTDSNGCSDSLTAEIMQPNPLLLSAFTINASCNGSFDGSIDLTVIGGTVPYMYSWATGETTEDLSALPAGGYAVTVTDSNACTSTFTDTITEPASVVTSAITGDTVAILANTSEIYSVINTLGSSYQWSVDGGAIPTGNGTNQVTVLWGDAGQVFYQVEVYEIDSNNCIGPTVYQVVEVVAAPGFSEGLMLNPVKVYPNPVQSTVTIEFEKPVKSGQVVINSVDGRIIHFQQIFDQKKITANMSLFADGLYFLSVIDSEGGRSVIPLVLQK